MKISPQSIRDLAELARLKLNPEEVKKFSKELSSILDYVEQLKEIDIADIEPTSQVTGLMNVLREDEENRELRIENSELEKIAPEFENGYVKVPKVL